MQRTSPRAWGLRLREVPPLHANCAGADVAFSSAERDRHLGIRPVSQLDTRPVVSPVNASRRPSRDAAHHSGPGRLAKPYPVEGFHLLSFASFAGAHRCGSRTAVLATPAAGQLMSSQRKCLRFLPALPPGADLLFYASRSQNCQSGSQLAAAAMVAAERRWKRNSFIPAALPRAVRWSRRPQASARNRRW